MIKHEWNVSAEVGLLQTTDNMSRLRGRVLRRESELWRVESCDSVGWLVTEIVPECLWIWTYQGTGFVPLVRTLARIAVSNKLPQIGWFTHHRAPKRVFRNIRPIIELTGEPGEFRYTLNCEELCALQKTLVDRSPSAISVGTMLISAIAIAPG